MDAYTFHRTGLGLGLELHHNGIYLLVVAAPRRLYLWWPMFMTGHPHKLVLDGLEFA